MSSGYAARVESLLGPYSREQRFPALLREWFATGAMVDNEDANDECHVCGHVCIRYLFEIKNVITGCVRENGGSVCILKFADIGVWDGKAITYDPVKKERVIGDIIERHKKKVRGQLRKTAALGVFQWLDGKNDLKAPVVAMRSIAASIYHQAEENAFLSPKQLSLFLWAADLAKVVVQLTAFKGCINLRKGKAKSQLESLTEFQITKLKGALTDTQLQILARYR